MSELEEEDEQQQQQQEVAPDLLFDDVFGGIGNAQGGDKLRASDESGIDIAWGETHIGSGPVIFRFLKIEGIGEERYEIMSKFLERLSAQGKNGFHFNLGKSDTDRHDMAISRLRWLLKYHETGLKIPKNFLYKLDRPLSEICCNQEEKSRFSSYDNYKKWQYRPDVYAFRMKVKEKDGKDILVVYDRKIIEFDGGYHKKYRQMMKDEWRDHDTIRIFPGLMIIRFDVDELIPETMLPSGDHCSTDHDILMKFMTGRNFYSIPGKLDNVGKVVVEQRNLRKVS